MRTQRAIWKLKLNHRTTLLLIGSAAVILGFAVRNASAQATSARAVPGVTAPGSSHSASQLSMEDRKFMKLAMAGGRFEVEASELAGQRAMNPAVKEFAAMLVSHHSEANMQLQRIATARGVTPPLGDNKHRKIIKSLGKQTGRKFDREYIDTVGIKTHKDDIDMFEAAGKTARDPALKGWIEAMLPVLRSHLEQARKLAQK